MKTIFVKITIPVLVLLFSTGCFFNSAKDHFVYNKLSDSIINGTVHKGMTLPEIEYDIGKPAEIKEPTLFNGVKAQIVIYRTGTSSNDKIYYLYFKDDELVDWKRFN